MSVDPAARLAALHVEDPNEALDLRFPPDEQRVWRELGMGSDLWNMVEDVGFDFIEHVDEAIRFNQSEVTITVEVAELIVFALKTRKRASNRPKHTRDQQLRRNALAALGRQLKATYRKSGISAGLAEEKAAKAVAEIGLKLGDRVSWQTFQKAIRSRPKKVPSSSTRQRA